MNRCDDESGTANRRSAGSSQERLLPSIGIMSIPTMLWLLAASLAVSVTDAGEFRPVADLLRQIAPRPMGAEWYLLDPGEYRLTLAADAETLHGSFVTVSGPRTRVTFELPARKVCPLKLTPHNP